MSEPKVSEEMMSLFKRRGFVWPSYEIYGGAAGMYDYGPLGFSFRNNIVEIWRDLYKGREGFTEIDSEYVNPAEVFKASGHVDKFADKITYCTECNAPWRADHLVKGVCENPDTMTEAQLDAAFVEHGITCPNCGGKLGPCSDFNLMFGTNIGPGSARPGYLRPETAQGIFVNFLNLYRYNREKLPMGVMQTGRGYRNEIAPRQGMIRMREFNMMEVELFIDPENKVWPRWDDMKDEMLTLVPNDGSGTFQMTAAEAVEKHIIANQALAYFVGTTKQLLTRAGVDPARLRFRQHLEDEMAHYANDCWDAEALLSYGWTEITGIADRGAWDLTRHSQFSGSDLSSFRKFDEPRETEAERIKVNHKLLGPMFKAKAKAVADAAEAMDPSAVRDGKLTVKVDGEDVVLGPELFEVKLVKEKVSGERLIPNVIEPSSGLDRIFYTALEHSYDKDADGNTVLHLPPEVAPIKVGVFPLMAKDGLEEIARQLCEDIHTHRAEAYYDDSGNIGRRYARMDEIGTPWCITVDYETLEGDTKGTVTIRDRDSKDQKRIKIGDAPGIIDGMLSGKLCFKDL